MVEVMRTEQDDDTEEQRKNRKTFAEELGIHYIYHDFIYIPTLFLTGINYF
jgi:hypothetical protein